LWPPAYTHLKRTNIVRNSSVKWYWYLRAQQIITISIQQLYNDSIQFIVCHFRWKWRTCGDKTLLSVVLQVNDSPSALTEWSQLTVRLRLRVCFSDTWWESITMYIIVLYYDDDFYNIITTCWTYTSFFTSVPVTRFWLNLLVMKLNNYIYRLSSPSRKHINPTV